MDLVREVLKGVSDTRLLTDHKPGPSPLHNLTKTYREKAAHNDNAPNLTDAFTGSDLKDGIEKLMVEDQVVMLREYLIDSKRIVPEETPAQVEERKTRTFFIKTIVAVLALGSVMLLGAVTAIAYRSGKAPSNELIGTFLEFAGEIVHLIWAG